MNTYFLLKFIHIVAVISWMAGMFYLPRLYVYHAENKNNPDLCAVFCVMERKLLRIIINPAMILSLISGFWLIFEGAASWSDAWLHAKLLLVLAMVFTHALYAKWRSNFSKGLYPYSSKFYRMVNEIPTILMMAIVFLVVFKPF